MELEGFGGMSVKYTGIHIFYYWQCVRCCNIYSFHGITESRCSWM